MQNPNQDDNSAIFTNTRNVNVTDLRFFLDKYIMYKTQLLYIIDSMPLFIMTIDVLFNAEAGTHFTDLSKALLVAIYVFSKFEAGSRFIDLSYAFPYYS